MSEPGLLAGRYRLGRELGRGGMGRVWEALDERLHRTVAVKEVVAPPELPPAERDVLHQRTLREARAAARISSPAAVTVYDVVDDDGRPWIVMERLHPRTLADVLAERGTLPPAEVARIGLRLLGALEAAHSAGVLHRDVKPANVMLTPDGEAVLTDFGIAALDGDASLTMTGALVGSPAYLAPERARGGPASPASDLWSLGATLYAAVEGRSPFQREGQLATLTAIVTDDLPPPTHAGPLAQPLERLLAKDPQDRPAVAEARAALQRVLDAEPQAAPGAAVSPPPPEEVARAERTSVLRPVDPPPGRTAPARPPAPQRRPAPAAPAAPARRPTGVALAALAVLALLVAGGWWLLQPDGEGAGDAAAPASPTARPAPTAESEPTAQPAPAQPAQTPEPEPDTGPDTEAALDADAVPAGYERYTDEQGWSVAVPQGWEVVRRDGPRVDLGEGSGPFLRVDSTDQPAGDPVADWETQERSVSQRLPGYQLVGIERSDFRGWQAGDWEFTYTPDGGAVRVVNRGFVVSDTEAHALYYSAPVDRFDPEVLQVASQTFTPWGAR